MPPRMVNPRPEDAATLTAIAHAAKQHWGYPERWLRRWAAELTVTPDYVCTHPVFAAQAGGELIGFCALRLDGAEASFDHFWVLPKAMGRGVGRALFQRAENAARTAGASRLEIESDPHAEGFYQRMGATTWGRKPASVEGVERYLVLLEKPLD